jgi:hemerythrin
LEWTEDLAVGNEMIDAQHKELFVRITDLVNAIKSKTCKFEIGPTTQFLQQYVIKHFTDEQNLMKSQNYPDFEAHKALHDKFIHDFEDLKKELEDETSNYSKSVYTNQMVVDWIVEHINQVDKKFGQYMKEQGK